jgi:hypothetical protein
MPRISKVSKPKMDLDYGWLFDIQNYEDLQNWWDSVRKNISTKDFNEAMKYKEGKAHANVLAQLAEIWGLDLITALSRFQEDIGRGMDEVLRDQKRLFVNSVGGYFGYSDILDISETREIDVWALPGVEPRFLQWPGGKHWYAKIGDEDIVIDGKQKWDTRVQAEAAAKTYMRGKKR